jgi:hypothetical protein
MSLYKAKKWLNFLELKLQLAIGTEYHKLHDVKDVIAYKKEGRVAVKNCLYKEFPNNSCNHQCNNSLSILKKNKDATIAVP